MDKAIGVAGCALVVVIVVACVIGGILWAMLGIACAGCWIFGMDFSHAWNVTFHHDIWPIIGWSFLFMGGLGAAVKSS